MRKEYYIKHKERLNKIAREKYKTNPEKYKKYTKEYKIKNYSLIREKRLKNKSKEANHIYKIKYGITIDDYNAMFLKQGGLCAICKKKQNSSKSLSVDHCHKTNKIRGLLCQYCNLGLGHFKDDTKLLQNAIKYLS